ncbi:unnamed protein product [Protopolystoma xenopodis]|uniref:Uncharacterized protein n=1 Tax=Protopolystoma xenopodis TaxID=117903 RepID=A0A448X1D5_9PLAT|nr:unnamed protein product [Protopolystoma xenopodis]
MAAACLPDLRRSEALRQAVRDVGRASVGLVRATGGGGLGTRGTPSAAAELQAGASSLSQAAQKSTMSAAHAGLVELDQRSSTMHAKVAPYSFQEFVG